jgi:hypothetical protein
VHGDANRELVEVKMSAHGAGIFARRDIRATTSIGNYPGVRRSLGGDWTNAVDPQLNAVDP